MPIFINFMIVNINAIDSECDAYVNTMLVTN